MIGEPAIGTTAERRLLADVEVGLSATAGSTGVGRLSPRVRSALLSVRRRQFVPESQRAQACDNRALPIGSGQTISQPFVVALMTELLALDPADRVLEIGTGSGYQTAVLAMLAARVYSIEAIPELAARAAAALARAGIPNIELRQGDGGSGWPEAAPFDAIIVTAAAPRMPTMLLDQLRAGGQMVLPVGPADGDQALMHAWKDSSGRVASRFVLPVAFVPLTGIAGH